MAESQVDRPAVEQKSDPEAFVELRKVIDDAFLKPVREEMGSLADETGSVSEEMEELTEKYAYLKSEVEGLEESTKTGSRKIYALIEDALYVEGYASDKESLVEGNAAHLEDLSSDSEKLIELLETLQQDHNSQASDLVDRVEANRSAINDWSDESRELQRKQLEEVAGQTGHLTEKLEEKRSALIEEAEKLSHQLQSIEEQAASDSDEITSAINELQAQQKHQRKLVIGLYALLAALSIASAVGLFIV